MTILHEIKPADVCASVGNIGVVGGAVSSNGVVGINCCSSAASSEISIDKSYSPMVINKLTDDHNNDVIRFPRCKEVDIEFENVRYTVRQFSFAQRKFVTKEILHGINGAFRSGELTAIMGPSGSGKSTLLNVMTGFRSTGVTGSILVNGKPQSTSSSKYRELSCYIHQDDLLRPQLAVGEVMMLAAHLKLGFKLSKQHKLDLIKHILAQLGLEHRFYVFTAKLSGGQKKRLAIALELISNPAVLYLDEPTTGLDSSSCSQCVSLLKKLASQGHTIVCTIHQPSALIFEMFDKLYTVVEGNCMYQGPVREMLPFLADQDLVCPSYHNPADYLMEVAVGEYPRDLNKLINAANKKYYEDVDLNQLTRVTRLISKIQENIENTACDSKSLQFPVYDYVKPVADDLALEEIKALKSSGGSGGNGDSNKPSLYETNIARASFFVQYLLLLKRILLCSRRNYFLLLARLMSHILLGVLFGYLYQNVGDKATTVLGNYVYLYGTVLLLVYTGKMAVVLTFPLEIGMLTREHFNRWYNLGPYFLSLLSFEIPFQIICATSYMAISIYLTGNSNEDTYRIYYFIILGVFATLSAQAWGFFVGATLPTKLAVFLGPILAVLFSVFGFCTRYIDITPMLRWMWYLSYFRAGFHGILNAVYGLDRTVLICPETVMYCHFRSPKVFLDYMMITDVSFTDSLTMMTIVIAVMHALTVITLWHKLNKR